MAAVMVAARRWFDGAWVVRQVRTCASKTPRSRGAPAQTDGRRGARAVPAARAVDRTDFLLPGRKRHSAWGGPEEGRPREPRADSASGVRASTCSVDRWRRAHRSMDAGASGGPGAPSRAGPRRSGMSACGRTGRRGCRVGGRGICATTRVPTAADGGVSFALD